MKRKTLITILFATLALYGCGDDEANGTGGTGGSGGTGGTAGAGGTGGSGGGTGGTGGIQGEVVYEQNFNMLDINGGVIGDEWKFFNNVFDGDGIFKFGYIEPPAGPAAAPNGPQICALVDDQGGPLQGAQQLSVYNDYECCGNPDQGHRNGTDLVEANVFRELPITAADIDNTVTFSFDAKRGNINDPLAEDAGGNLVCNPNVCDSTASAFIKTIDALGNLTNSPSIDTTNLPVDWTRLSVSLDLTDPALEGQTLQVGFQTNASNFEPSGNFYDNVLVTKSPTP